MTSHLINAASPSFADLGVPAPLVRTLAEAGITTPFPIQAATLPDALAGRDVLGRGRTGSGKTYAFALPLVTRLSGGARAKAGRPRALILAPTRELVSQIEATVAPLAASAGLRTHTIVGGVKAGPQQQALRQGVDIIVATPGRLEDLTGSGHCRLDGIEVTVLDEADHMADLGFLPTVRKLLDRTPRNGQRLLFSATLDRAVDVLVSRYLDAPAVHSVDSAESPVELMAHHVLHVERNDRLSIIADLTAAPGRTVVFTRTKRGAKTLSRQLNAHGVRAVELHGNLSQGARTRNLAKFSNGAATTLVATDIAARGIHVDDVGLVLHADPPVEHKAYLHRSGRTARAGSAGTVVTIMMDGQVRDVRDLTRKAGISPTTTKVVPGHPLLVNLAPGERLYDKAVMAAASSPGQTSRNGGGADRGSYRGGQRRPQASGRGESRSRAGSSARGGAGAQNGSSSQRSGAGSQRAGSGSQRGTGGGAGRQHSAANFSSSR